MSQNRKLFVGNISSRAQREDVEDLFSKYGKVLDVKIVDKQKFIYGFVEFGNTEEANEAMSQLQGAELKGERLKLEYASGPKAQKTFDRDQKGCFQCGSTSHMKRDCPEASNDRPRGDRDDRRRSRSRDRKHKKHRKHSSSSSVSRHHKSKKPRRSARSPSD